MKQAWNALILICSIANAMNVIQLWHDGGPPNAFVWVSSILFSIGVAMTAIGELAGFES